jgi:hypothetical protein
MSHPSTGITKKFQIGSMNVSNDEQHMTIPIITSGTGKIGNGGPFSVSSHVSISKLDVRGKDKEEKDSRLDF